MSLALHLFSEIRSEGKEDGDGGQVVGRYELDLVADRLGFLFGLDEDVAALGTAFGFLRMKWYAEWAEVATKEFSIAIRQENVRSGLQ